MPDSDWWAALWPDPDSVLIKLGIKPDMTVLDLCCGDGYFTARLAKLVQGKVYGLDMDAETIARAKAAVADLRATVRGWILADARQVAGQLAEPVDYVLMANTLHGVPDRADLLRQVHASLRPGGCLELRTGVLCHARERRSAVFPAVPRLRCASQAKR